MNGICRSVSLPQQTAPSLPRRTVPSLNERLLNKWLPLTLVDERLPPSMNVILDERHSPSLIDEWHPSINGQHLHSSLMNGVLQWCSPSLVDERCLPSLEECVLFISI